MNNKIITFGDNEIEERKFHCSKNSVVLEDLNIDNILISNKISFTSLQQNLNLQPLSL